MVVSTVSQDSPLPLDQFSVAVQVPSAERELQPLERVSS